jgi:phage tail sheath protein FI
VPPTENTLGDSDVSNRGDVDTTISSLKDRQLNTSYGCGYYPWVQAKDTINGATLWVPPSIVGLGTMASSEKKTELWFAPAGFNRGGLSEGAAGIPIIGVKQKLTSKDRDKLYEASINPIASFPNEGIVVFGQKTLQVTRSALDRINVRRLLIYLKKAISRIATTVLFEPNIESVWNDFVGKTDPLLMSVKLRFGLTDYKLVADKTLNTPESIDRNEFYAKVFLKPARAIEYIGLDFVIMPSGASFED